MTKANGVSLPALAYGRTVVAKSCIACGELKMRSDFYGKKPVGDRACIECRKSAGRTNYARERDGKGLVHRRLFHQGVKLIAATCATCGEFKQGVNFGTIHGIPRTSMCFACKAVDQPKDPQRAVLDMKRYRAREQKKTAPKARNHGKQWTGPELEIASRPELTATQAAKMLGRTHVAVRAARQKLRRDPKWASVAGLGSSRVT